MKAFPAQAFVPKSSKLSQLIHENPERGMAPRLEFSIEIVFESFELEDEEVSTALWLSGLRSDVSDWRGLDSRSFQTRELGLIDGSIRLFQAMNPVEVSKLALGPISGNSVAADLEVEIDFEIEGDDEYGIVPLNLSCELEIADLRVATSIEKRLNGDAAAIRAEIASAVDIEAYGAMEKVPGGVLFPLVLQG